MTQKTESTARTIAAIVGMLAAVGTIVVGYTRLEVGPVETKVNALEIKVDNHTGNTSIHRTAEEGKERERGEQVWRELLMERLNSIDNRLGKLEDRK